jgi:diacylglycerol kinase family enzyme
LHELQSKDRKRKILAFINPIGGKGNALNIWEKAKKIML